MKKFMIIPLIFFNMSTCMFKNLASKAKDRAEIIKNSGKAVFKKIITPKYSHPTKEKYQARERSLSTAIPHDQILDENYFLKSIDNSFKEIIPPNITKRPHSQIKFHADRVIESNRQDKIKEVLATGIVIGLSKIDYRWLYQSIKNFFNPEAQGACDAK